MTARSTNYNKIIYRSKYETKNTTTMPSAILTLYIEIYK